MPNLMSAMCGLPNLGPASCIACTSSVCVHVIVGLDLLVTVLVEPGPAEREDREKASAFCFKTCDIYSFIICLHLVFCVAELYGLKSGLVCACYCVCTEQFNEHKLSSAKALVPFTAELVPCCSSPLKLNSWGGLQNCKETVYTEVMQ